MSTISVGVAVQELVCDGLFHLYTVMPVQTNNERDLLALAGLLCSAHKGAVFRFARSRKSCSLLI